MDRLEHVYCTNCKHWEALYKSIGTWVLPNPCIDCFPYDPEDSFAFEERPRYEEKQSF